MQVFFFILVRTLYKCYTQSRNIRSPEINILLHRTQESPCRLQNMHKHAGSVYIAF